MKLILTIFILVGSIAWAEGSVDEITYTPPTADQDIKGSLTAPTAEQQKALEEHAKKHQSKKKNKKKSKKAAKSAVKKTN